MEHRKYLLSLPKKNVWVYGHETTTGELTAIRPLTLQEARRFKKENPNSVLEICQVDRADLIAAAGRGKKPQLFYRRRKGA